MKSKISLLIISIFILALTPLKKVIVAGTGDSEFFFRALASEFGRYHPRIIIEVPPSCHTGGGIKKVVCGKADIARVGRAFLPHEKKYNLIRKDFGYTPVVFVVHPSVKNVNNLTKEQIVDLYTGKIKNWTKLGGPNHKIYLVKREAGDSCRIIIEKEIPKLKNIPNSIGYTAYNTPDALKAIENHPFTIGYLPLAVAKAGKVKVLSLDGVAPTLENVKKGLYKLVIPLGIAYKKKNLSKEAKLFIDFLFSQQAKKIMKIYRIIPYEELKWVKH